MATPEHTLTPSEAVIFRAQLADDHRRYISKTQHRISRLDQMTRGGAGAEHQALLTAELYLWTADMLTAAVSSASSLPSPVTFKTTLRPSASGLYLFARPIEFAGLSRKIAAIAWHDIGPLTLFWLYINTAGTTWSDIGRLAAVASFGIADGIDVATAMPHDFRHSQTEEEFGTEARTAATRFVIASWLWLKQRILVARPEPISRNAKKLADRVKVLASVNVVVLRRAESSHPGDGEAHCSAKDWQCQWLVKGHWRQQFYPSTHEHRPLWIEPYLKGPEDKPLKLPTDTVFSVSR